MLRAQRSRHRAHSASSSDGAPRYVLALRPVDHQVVVGPKVALERTTLTASGVNWILGRPDGPLRVTAQIRHRHQPAPATVSAVDSTTGSRAPSHFSSSRSAFMAR